MCRHLSVSWDFLGIGKLGWQPGLTIRIANTKLGKVMSWWGAHTGACLEMDGKNHAHNTIRQSGGDKQYRCCLKRNFVKLFIPAEI